MDQSHSEINKSSVSAKPSSVMYLTKVFEFSASHRMANPGLSEEENFRQYGKCSNPAGHGHNYRLEVTVAGPVNLSTGCVMNIESLARIVREKVIDVVDHRNLNVEVPYFRQMVPSMEHIAQWIWNEISPEIHAVRLYRIRLFETERNFVEYLGE